jgi:hypothetical protein
VLAVSGPDAKLHEALGRIEATQTYMLASQARIEKALLAHVDEDEARIGALEAAQQRLRGAAWVVGGLAGFASAVAGWLGMKGFQ